MCQNFNCKFYIINKIKEEIILATEFCPRDCMHEAQLQEIQIPQNISKVAHGLHGTEARGCDAHVGAARGAGVAHSGEYIALFVVHPLLHCQDWVWLEMLGLWEERGRGVELIWEAYRFGFLMHLILHVLNVIQVIPNALHLRGGNLRSD